MKALTEKLQETRSKIKPKSKFQFKTFRNDSAISVKDAAELASQQRLQPPSVKSAIISSAESSLATTPAYLMTPPNEGETRATANETSPQPTKDYNADLASGSESIRRPSFSQATNVDISGHNGLHITLPSSASKATSSGSLTKLENCVIDMSGPTSSASPFAGLALKSIKNSLIIAGHVAGAAHITAVEDSIIVVASRQVRMHECKNVDIYLHCASRPIIEDCSNVRFAPIPQQHVSLPRHDLYDQTDDQQMVSSDEEVKNQWDQVDDFKWLKMEPSPNWSILPVQERLGDEICGHVIDEPGTSVEEELKKVGLNAVRQ